MSPILVSGSVHIQFNYVYLTSQNAYRFNSRSAMDRSLAQHLPLYIYLCKTLALRDSLCVLAVMLVIEALLLIVRKVTTHMNRKCWHDRVKKETAKLAQVSIHTRHIPSYSIII